MKLKKLLPVLLLILVLIYAFLPDGGDSADIGVISNNSVVETVVSSVTEQISCTHHVSIMHCSRGSSWNDHVATIYWSRD